MTFGLNKFFDSPLILRTSSELEHIDTNSSQYES